MLAYQPGTYVKRKQLTTPLKNNIRERTAEAEQRLGLYRLYGNN